MTHQKQMSLCLNETDTKIHQTPRINRRGRRILRIIAFKLGLLGLGRECSFKQKEWGNGSHIARRHTVISLVIFPLFDSYLKKVISVK